jgi:8-amino-7-oxononanoate synthase
MTLDDWFEKKLDDRMSSGLFRKLSAPEGLIDFTSNDYLGLARSQKLFDRIKERTPSIHAKNGATGSRLLSGNSLYTEEVEGRLAATFQGHSALIFNSGYTANLAVLSSIPQRNDTIIYDELAHTCIKDGARLSLAKYYSFKHNDLNDLESKISRAEGKIFIAIESIYSMDGDQCPLRDIVAIAERYNASIVLDEAHSTGVIGDAGSGLAVSKNLQNKIAIRVYTFGKAMGIHGACVVGSKPLINYLINFSRPFIYTTALAPHSIVAIDCAFEFIRANNSLQKILRDRVDFFLSETRSISNRTKSESAIQTIIIPGNEQIRKAAAILHQDGFDVRPILSPTVAAGAERLRICLHTFNTEKEIKDLATALTKLE